MININKQFRKFKSLNLTPSFIDAEQLFKVTESSTELDKESYSELDLTCDSFCHFTCCSDHLLRYFYVDNGINAQKPKLPNFDNWEDLSLNQNYLTYFEPVPINESAENRDKTIILDNSDLSSSPRRESTFIDYESYIAGKQPLLLKRNISSLSSIDEKCIKSHKK